jgi:hypothetical protein
MGSVDCRVLASLHLWVARPHYPKAKPIGLLGKNGHSPNIADSVLRLLSAKLIPSVTGGIERSHHHGENPPGHIRRPHGSI